METGCRVRSTARALLVTPAREILLVRYVAHAIGRRFWITPGGEIEAGESEREAVAREVREETGLADAPIGPAVWTRSVKIRWAAPPFVQRETYFWAPTARFEPSANAIPTDAERSEIGGTPGGRSARSKLPRSALRRAGSARCCASCSNGTCPAAPIEAD